MKWSLVVLAVILATAASLNRSRPDWDTGGNHRNQDTVHVVPASAGFFRLPLQNPAEAGTTCLLLQSLATAIHRQLNDPPWTATAREEKLGRDLLAKVVAAMGGSQKIDELTSYTDIHKATAKLPQGDQQIGGRWMIEFARSADGVQLPDRVREEVTAGGPQGAPLTVNVFAPGNSFSVDQGRTRLLTEARRLEWMLSLQRHPLMLLRARKQPGFRVAAAGKSQVDGRPVDLLLVELYGLRLTAGVDTGRGHILTVSYRDKDWHTGVPGQFIVRYLDYRAVAGLVLPFRHDYSCDGKLLLTGILESISLNQKIDPKLFEKP